MRSPPGLYFRSTEILHSFVIAAIQKPKLTIAFALLALVALAGTMTYAGFLVVGVIADYLGTGRTVAGLLLGILFARIPRLSQGKLRTVGLLPKIARRPIMVSLLALCIANFLLRGEYVSVVFTGFAMVFLLTFPWMKRAVSKRMLSSFFKSTPTQNRQKDTDDMVIDVEFRERKDDK